MAFQCIFSLTVSHSIRQATRFRTLPKPLPFTNPFLFWLCLILFKFSGLFCFWFARLLDTFTFSGSFLFRLCSRVYGGPVTVGRALRNLHTHSLHSSLFEVCTCTAHYNRGLHLHRALIEVCTAHLHRALIAVCTTHLHRALIEVCTPRTYSRGLHSALRFAQRTTIGCLTSHANESILVLNDAPKRSRD